MGFRCQPEPAFFSLAQLVDHKKDGDRGDAGNEGIRKVPANGVDVVPGRYDGAEDNSPHEAPDKHNEVNGGDGRDIIADGLVRTARLLVSAATLNPRRDGIGQPTDREEADHSNLHGAVGEEQVLTQIERASDEHNLADNHDDEPQEYGQGGEGVDENPICLGPLLLHSHLGTGDEPGDTRHQDGESSGVEEAADIREAHNMALSRPVRGAKVGGQLIRTHRKGEKVHANQQKSQYLIMMAREKQRWHVQRRERKRNFEQEKAPSG
jgi:hypothetical protein